MEKSPLKRYVYAVIGILLVGLAAIGAMLPGIPTVGPLLLASYFLLKSSPALERRLVRNRFFGRYVCYLDGTQKIPNSTRIGSILMMWASITLSGILIYFIGKKQIWLLITLGVAGAIGTVVIWRFKRNGIKMQPDRPISGDTPK